MSINSEWGKGARPEPISEAVPVDWRVHASGDTPTAQSYAEIKAANEEFGKYLEQVHAQAGLYSEDGQRAQVAAFQNTPAAKVVETAEQRVVDQTAQHQADYDRVLQGLAPKGDTAAELRAQRAWDRTQRTLDSTESGAVVAAATRAIASADRETLGTLLQELPSYLDSKGLPTEAIEQAAVQAVPELADAGRKLTKSKQSEAMLRAAANMARTLKRRLPVFAKLEFRQALSAACAGHARLGPASLVLYDVTTLHFETDAGDGFRAPGFSKERRLDPQITLGLLTDATGFPLNVAAFEGNMAETATMVPVINAFKAAHHLTDVTVVADAGMVSGANQTAIQAAGLSFIRAPADHAPALCGRSVARHPPRPRHSRRARVHPTVAGPPPWRRPGESRTT